jgi:hypothetical protein
MDNQVPQTEYKHSLPAGVEHRFSGDVQEVRATDEGVNRLRGYALKWDQKYQMFGFSESISREALKDADLSDVRALLNHDTNIVLGRTTAGTLRLRSDEIGLAYEIDLPDTQAGRDLAISVKRGDITQSSWGFSLNVNEDDDWTRSDAGEHRTIKRVRRVWDVSPVTFPANPDTTVAKRSLEAAKSEWQSQQENEEKINQRSAQVRAILAQYPNK